MVSVIPHFSWKNISISIKLHSGVWGQFVCAEPGELVRNCRIPKAPSASQSSTPSERAVADLPWIPQCQGRREDPSSFPITVRLPLSSAVNWGREEIKCFLLLPWDFQGSCSGRVISFCQCPSLKAVGWLSPTCFPIFWAGTA